MTFPCLLTTCSLGSSTYPAACDKMLSKKGEQRTFSNGRLRDQWEQRAQSVADKNKKEAEFRKKSSINLLFSKWNYHWLLVSDMTDFKRVTCGDDEEEKIKPKIRFKIVPPPPPKPKAEPPPPSAPPRSTLPRRSRPKRKVEVDVFHLCWRESWMSIKPPKYLFLTAKEKTRILGFTVIEMTSNRNYKANICGLEPSWIFPNHKWTQSWKQAKSTAQFNLSEPKQFQWEILLHTKLAGKLELEKYSLPVWAGTWKIMNFPFRQQKKDWDHLWPDYQQNFSDKSERVQQLDEEDELFDWAGWEYSWKLFIEEFETEDATDYGGESEIEDDTDYEEEYETEDDTLDDETLSTNSFCTETNVTTRIINICMPGWRKSWLLSAPPPEECEERQKSWNSCWGYNQQLRWRKASWQSQHDHSAMMDRRRKATNHLLVSELDSEIIDTIEWSDAWKAPRRWIPAEDEEEEEEEEDKKESEIMEEEEEEEEVEDEGVDKEDGELNEDEEDEDKAILIEKHEKDLNKKAAEDEGDEEDDEGVDEDEEDGGKEEEEEGVNKEDEKDKEQESEEDEEDGEIEEDEEGVSEEDMKDKEWEDGENEEKEGEEEIKHNVQVGKEEDNSESHKEEDNEEEEEKETHQMGKEQKEGMKNEKEMEERDEDDEDKETKEEEEDEDLCEEEQDEEKNKSHDEKEILKKLDDDGDDDDDDDDRRKKKKKKKKKKTTLHKRTKTCTSRI
ncbi:uncharacterized protein KZ484_021133 [Pholidichthys leucotaenia]